METIRLTVQTDEDGAFSATLPSRFANKRLSITVVFEVTGDAVEVDENGYPIGFFDRTFGAFADTPIERQPQNPLEIPEEVT